MDQGLEAGLQELVPVLGEEGQEREVVEQVLPVQVQVAEGLVLEVEQLVLLEQELAA